MAAKNIVLIPVYNEEKHLQGLLQHLRAVYSGDVLFVDDGSVDCSPCMLKEIESPNTRVIMQPENRGYGATLLRGFKEVCDAGYDHVITMDSDGQHRPDWIPDFFKAIENWDIVSGSRYKEEFTNNGEAPKDRRAINHQITELINSFTGYNITDSFGGFKAYKTSALRQLKLDDTGYAMPLQLWVQAKHFKLTVTELPISRIYDDPNRKFGGELDNPEIRLKLYLDTIEKERAKWNV
jgi:dolichol-phosphate mannosyltransferase